MPTYEYRCAECGNEFEIFGKMSDPPVTECTRCGAQAQRRISGGAGLLFKGSGFYITDYRGEGYKKAAEGDKGASAPPSGGGESTSRTKSEPAAAPKSESKSSGSSSTGGSSAGGASKSE